MKKIMLVMSLGVLVSSAVPAFAQSRGLTAAATANAAANAGGGSVLDGVISGIGQGSGSAKTGISSLLGGDAVAKIMPAAGGKHNKGFNKHGKNGGGRFNRGSSADLISGSAGGGASVSSGAGSSPAAIPARSQGGAMAK